MSSSQNLQRGSLPAEIHEPESSRNAAHRWGSYATTMISGWIVLLAVTLSLGWLITSPLADSSLIEWDEQVPVDWEAARTATLDPWSAVGSGLADTLTVIIVASIIGVILLIARRWTSVLLLVSALVLEVTVFSITAFLIERDRPDVELMDVAPPTSAFPSGHTAAGTALYLSLALLVGWNFRSRGARILAWIVAPLLILSVALSRLYRGMHHPTDLAWGFVLGLSCVVLAYLAVRLWVGLSARRNTGDDADPSRRTIDSTESGAVA